MEFIAQGIRQAILLLFSTNAELWSAISHTLQTSTFSMICSLLPGLPLGFYLGYYRFPGKAQCRLIVDTLLSLPTVFVGLMVYAVITRRGPLGDWELLFTLPGIGIGQSVLALPIIIALTAAAVENRDEGLGLTLQSLGAGPHRILLTTLWEIRHALLAAAVTAYGRVLTEVGISMMVGGNIKWHTRTITTAIALETNKGEFALGVALGLVLLVIAFGVNLSLAVLKRKAG